MNPAQMRVELLQKGWTIDEIEAAISIMKDAGASKSKFVRFLDKVVFWVNLILAMTGNFIISVVLIPFMLFAPTAFLYPILFVVGLAFGALYDMVVFDIEKIDAAPKIFVGPFLLAIALVNIYIITALSNRLATAINYPSGIHTPILVAVFYTSGFLAPYIYTHWQEILQKYYFYQDKMAYRKSLKVPQKKPVK